MDLSSFFVVLMFITLTRMVAYHLKAPAGFSAQALLTLVIAKAGLQDFSFFISITFINITDGCCCSAVEWLHLRGFHFYSMLAGIGRASDNCGESHT